MGDQNKFEVRIENIGSATIKVPFSLHLADLQPKDPSQKFGYSELTVELWISGDEKWSLNTGGAINLYGSGHHPNTILTMLPRGMGANHRPRNDHPSRPQYRPHS